MLEENEQQPTSKQRTSLDETPKIPSLPPSPQIGGLMPGELPELSPRSFEGSTLSCGLRANLEIFGYHLLEDRIIRYDQLPLQLGCSMEYSVRVVGLHEVSSPKQQQRDITPCCGN